MGVNTKSFDNASDMITFSRASGGYGLTKVSYGPELVTNGDFATDSDWTLSTGATISGGVLTIDYTVGTNGAAQTLSVTAGKIYQVSINVSGSGSARISFAGEAVVLDNGDNLYNFVATDTSEFRVRSHVNFSGTIDNISVREVTYNSSAADATLQLTYHPNDIPRIEYDLDGSAKGLLIEEARTNISSNSLLFDPYQGIGAVASTETAPDGSTNATLVTASGNGRHRVKAGSTTILTSTGVAYAISTFVKNVDADYVQILNGGDANYFANFDLVNGTVGTTGSATTATITEYSNGWYRIAALFDGTGLIANNGTYIYIAPSASATYSQGANNPGAQMHLWGFQTEAGSFPTSYIETTGSTATRASDVASIPVSKFGYNQTEGTLFVDFKTPDTGGANALELGDSANGANRYIIRNGLAYYSSAGGPQVVISYTASTNNQRAGFAVQSNDAVAVVNGSTVGTDNSVTLFSNPTILGIGAYAYNLATEKLNGHIKSIQYYPRRLTDAQLQELTL